MAMLLILEYFQTHPCIDCGESDPRTLEFDHRGPKNFTIGDVLRRADVALIAAEIELCDVRCSNCHRKRHLANSYRALTVEELKEVIASTLAAKKPRCGVYWNQGKWIAKIRVNRILIHLGVFHNELDAAEAFNRAREKRSLQKRIETRGRPRKLTMEAARKIRKEHRRATRNGRAKIGCGPYALAKKYKVSDRIIKRIIKGQIYREAA